MHVLHLIRVTAGSHEEAEKYAEETTNNWLDKDTWSCGVVNFPERALEANITPFVNSNVDTVVFRKTISFLTQFHADSIGFTKHPKVCKGCKNYYGRKDGEHVIICAIHPYGYQADTCPDYNA